MRGKKSPMIMGLIGAMLLSANAFAAVPSDFSDFPTDWSASAMTHAVQNGLLNGSDGKILPKGLLTRAQMATMVNRAFASSAKASLTSFTDMVPGVWHYDEMAKSVRMGVFQGADGKLSPDDPITREQAFAVLARAFGLADGSAAALNKFSDGTQVSSWAKGAVAALVEQGYVSGADGALNPQSYITRAEFAQVMDALVAAYGDQDLKDQTVEGNLILRANSTLENVTVKGDLILADGVSAASLKNVTVTGRLVVRGGTDGVSLTKSTPKKGIQLANPNGTPKVTVDGKAYLPTGLPGSGSNSGGSSSGGSSGGSSSSSGGGSSSGGNSSTKTDLVVADQTKLVNVDWGQYVAVRFTSGNDLRNCTLTVDGTVVNKACSNVTTDGSIVKWEATTWNPAKLVITKGSQSQTVTLSQTANPATPTVGKKADAYYFLANGPVYVWDYHLTNYDAAGTVRVAPATTQFSLTNKEQDAIKFYSPDAILKQDETASNHYKVSGTVELMFNYAKGTDAEKAWVDGINDVDLVSADENNKSLNSELSWHLDTKYQHGTGTVARITVPLGQSNFYSNGRYQLRVTSNGTSKLFPIHVVNEVVPKLQTTSGSVKSGDKVYFKVKNMTYGITQPIYRVDLTDPQGNTKTLTKIDDWYLIGDSFILYNDNTNNIPYDGNYTVTVYADGFQQFSKTFFVTGGESLNIRKAALAYGIDTYSGSSLSGGGTSSGSGSEGGSNTMNAYLVFDADLLANANIMTALNTGNAYASAIAERWAELSHVDVYAKGSSDVYTYAGYADAVNSAHVAGTALTFADYAAKEGAEKTAGRPYAVKQVLEDNLLGKTTAFSETANKAAPDITLVKLVDNKYVAATEVTEGQDAVFRCLDKDYLTKLAANGSIYKGTNSYASFNKNTDYNVDKEKGTLTISREKLTLGDNSITIQVEGYQTVRLSVRYQKVLEKVSLTGPTEGVQLGDPVTITCNAENHKDGVCDFFANVTSVELTGPDGNAKTILPDRQESLSQKIGYTVTGNTLTLGKDLFSTAGNYSVIIRAGHGYEHEPKKVEFEIKAATPETPEPPSEGNKDVPAYESWTLTRGYLGSGKLCFGANGKNDDIVKPYLTAIKEIKLNDKSLAPVNNGMFLETGKYYVDSGTAQTIRFDAGDFSAKDSTTITIIADGYKDFTLVIGADGKVVAGGDSGETPGGDGEVTAKEPPMNWTAELDFWKDYTLKAGMGHSEFMENISTVIVNEMTYEDGYVNNNTKYSISNTTDGIIKLGKGNMTSTPNVVVIKATGYKDLTLTIAADKTVTATVGDSSGSGSTETPETPSEEGKEVPSYVGWNYYQLIFDQDGSNAEAATYLTKISKITIKNTTGETVLTESSSGWSLDATQYYKLNSDSDKYISFSSSAFSKTGDNIITIQADSYKDLTLTITNGNLKTDN